LSKIIRTVRVTGPVVTLGEAERELYLSDRTVAAPPLIDLPGLLQVRVAGLRQRLDDEWSARLQQEREALQAAADQRLQESEARAETERQQVHQRRYEEGYQAGVEAKEAEAREAVERLDILHQALERERAQILRGAETLVVDLALAVARRITAVQVELDDKVLLREIRAALELLAQESRLEIKVHPEDLQLARRFAQRWTEKVAREAVIRVLPSDAVGRGGCMIEGEEGNVDARVESQLTILHQALRTALAEPRPAGSGERD
jgi:flagellar assembly protein FliH